MTSAIKVGIAGFGTAGEYFHGRFVAAYPAYDLIGVVTHREERAARARALSPHAEAVPDIDALLALGPDLVIVASPPKAHRDNVIRALEAGCAVVVDKPVAPSRADVEAMIAADTMGRLTVYQNRRYDRDFRTLQRLVHEGTVGQPHTFESRFEWWKPDVDNWKAATSAANGGGTLLDLGPHLIDQAVQLLGRVTAVDYASLRTLRPGGQSEDDVFICLRHESGAQSRLTMSALVGLEGARLRLSGDAGTLTIDGKDEQEAKLRGQDASPTDPGFDVDSRQFSFAAGGKTSRVPLDHGSYADFYAALARSLRDGAPVPVDPRDSLEVMRIIEEVRRAAS